LARDVELRAGRLAAAGDRLAEVRDAAQELVRLGVLTAPTLQPHESVISTKS
jgi:hypothetical protein